MQVPHCILFAKYHPNSEKSGTILVVEADTRISKGLVLLVKAEKIKRADPMAQKNEGSDTVNLHGYETPNSSSLDLPRDPRVPKH